jgi:hypothetical protein
MRRSDLIGMAIVILVFGKGAFAELAPEVVTPMAIVQGQVDAFNSGDATAFASFYADNVEIFDLGPEVTPNLTGRSALLARYEPMLRKFHPQATILSRMQSGEFIIDKERTAVGGRASEGVAIYQIEERKIRRVWFTP